MEMEVKRMTKRNAGTSRKQPGPNSSASFANLLSKNIERIRKNNRDFNPKVNS
jgi:chromosome condensin MukBEF ATPase and DNA-binding subunit MukB